MASFPAELLPFRQNGMESNNDKSFNQQLQVDSRASSGDSQHTASLFNGAGVKQLRQQHGVDSREEESETAVASWISETGQPQQDSAEGAAFAAIGNRSGDGAGASIDGSAESVSKGGAGGGNELEADPLQGSPVPADYGPVPAG